MRKISRRDFVRMSAYAAGSVFVTSALGGLLTACDGEDDNEPASFNHGVASGDPLSNQVIIWTRVTPQNTEAQRVSVTWEIATDPAFTDIIANARGITTAERDFTVKVDIVDLTPGTTYYYRFKTDSETSQTGTTATLPEGDVSRAKFAVMSCSNYPTGYFHAYAEAARIGDLDAVLHLGDYIYEYARDEFASEDAAALGREVLPETELLSLADYRMRYAQYRTDMDLQELHQNVPFIVVWDDHEVANDTWVDGAQNHSEDTEGLFVDRLNAALQAYSEWMPIRPSVDTDIASLARNFEYGNLVNLCMLDTRLVARDRQLNLTDYIDPSTGIFDSGSYAADIGNPNRRLIGEAQLSWLNTQFMSQATWNVLGQQVLMGTMELPAAIATQQLSIAEFSELAALAQIAVTNPAALTPEQLQRVNEQGALLQLSNIPYNLDAWDGYPIERAQVLSAAAQASSNLVVLAGDTHNAWANNIRLQGQPVGVEFATAGVSSPGLEAFLGLDSIEAVAQTEAGLVQLIEGLQYCNLSDRGFLVVEFTPQQVTAEWVFVSSVKEANYDVLDTRNKTITVAANTNQIS